jgi:hypothetical protein
MELKVLCNCGQKYAFDVDPVDNQMPHPVNCPTCGEDGTTSANELIALAAAGITPPPLPPQARLTARVVSPGTTTAKAPATLHPVNVNAAAPAENSDEFNLGKGIFGAFLGALLATVVLVVISFALGFKVPFFGVITGSVAGFGAKKLFKGTDSKLGVITAIIALGFTVGALMLMFGTGAFASVGCIISMVLSVVMAWRVAGG